MDFFFKPGGDWTSSNNILEKRDKGFGQNLLHSEREREREEKGERERVRGERGEREREKGERTEVES